MGERLPDKECPQCKRGVPYYNDHCYSCGYNYPGHDDERTIVDETPTEPIIVWSYPGRTQADAAEVYGRHATKLAAVGYEPISQSWSEGRPGAGRILALGLLANSIRPNGYLTVTYRRNSASERPDGDDLDKIRRLGDLRDAGLVTEDEFLAKKAELLARL